MRELQIYKKEHMYSTYYALVDNHGNGSLNAPGEKSAGFTGFQQDGSWSPVELADAPAWLQEQIRDNAK